MCGTSGAAWAAAFENDTYSITGAGAAHVPKGDEAMNLVASVGASWAVHGSSHVTTDQQAVFGQERGVKTLEEGNRKQRK